MNHSNDSKTILITGAAGNLGQAVVRVLGNSESRLILVDKDLARLEHTFGASSEQKQLIAVDLTRRAMVFEKLRDVVGGRQRIDAVCHLAGGFAMGKKVHELSEADWNQMQDMNIAACVVPEMIANWGGKLVAVGAISAHRGVGGMGAYICSKSNKYSMRGDNVPQAFMEVEALRT